MQRPKSYPKVLIVIVFVLTISVASCSGQTEVQALQRLREMTRDGKLPPENAVVEIENRFANKETGALAKLLHARIRFESNDPAGAAAILNSDVFKKYTRVADQALWLRGRALQQSGNHAEAIKVFGDLVRDYPDSIRAREARLLWATSAIASGHAVEIPPMLVPLTEKN